MIMNKIIIIVGLPGSGKSCLINEKYFDKKKYLVIDDMKGGAVFDCSNFCYSKHYPNLIIGMIQGKKDIVISDISFCDINNFNEAKNMLEWWINNNDINYKITSIFFKNDPDQCKKNIKDQNTSRLEKINEFTKNYNPFSMKSDGDEIVSVYKEK